jgi:hypothetical protein
MSILGRHQHPTVLCIGDLELDIGGISELYFFNLAAQNTSQKQVSALLYMPT